MQSQSPGSHNRSRRRSFFERLGIFAVVLGLPTWAIGFVREYFPLALAGDSTEPARPMRILLLVIPAFIGILLFTSACDRVGTDLRPAPERKNMEPAKIVNLSQTLAIPPIDAHAPANTETATFALG